MNFEQLKEQAAAVDTGNVGYGDIQSIKAEDGKLQYDGLVLTEEAERSFLHNIKFSSAIYNKMSEDLSSFELNNVLQYFKDLVEQKDVTMRVNDDDGVIESISNVKRASFSNLQLIEDVEEYVNSRDADVELAQTSSVTADGLLKMDLINNDFSVDVFDELGLSGGYSDDIFKFGASLTNDPSGMRCASVESYIQRLICENGMMTKEMSYKARARNKDPYASFRSKVLGAINDQNVLDGFKESMLDNIRRMFKTEASVNELEEVLRNFGRYYVGDQQDTNNDTFSDENMEINRKAETLRDHFQVDRISERYGDNVMQKSEKWKSTANTGIRLYDLMNISTYLISHNELDGLSLEDEINVNKDIIKTFFKKEYDLENIAPSLEMESDILEDVRQRYRLN